MTTAVPPPTPQFSFLTFRLANQLYGLPVSCIVQIIEIPAFTPLPQAPRFIPGLLNYHGDVIPLIDMRLRFDLPFKPYTLRTPVILFEAGDDGRLLSMVVDVVEAVAEIDPANFTPYKAIIPDEIRVKTAVPNDSLSGIAQAEDQIIPILQAEFLLSSSEASQLKQARKQEA